MLERVPRTRSVQRILQEDEALLEARKASGEALSGEQLADLNLYFQGLTTALSKAVTAAGRGGSVLVEVHRQGPNDGTACTCNTSQCNYIAVEYWGHHARPCAGGGAEGALTARLGPCRLPRWRRQGARRGARPGHHGGSHAPGAGSVSSSLPTGPKGSRNSEVSGRLRLRPQSPHCRAPPPQGLAQERQQCAGSPCGVKR